MNILNQQVSEELNARRSELAAAMVEREFVRHPELEERYGKTVRARMLDDTGYHIAYLAQAISADSPALFGSYMAWVKVLLAKRNVPEGYLTTLLQSMKESLVAHLALDFSGVACAYLDLALEQLPDFPAEISSFIVEGTAFAPLAAQYLEALLRGHRDVAHKLILETVGAGSKVSDLYLRVFQPSQYEVGRLWQINQISVAQEHYCTAATQLIMAQLYPYIFAAEKTRGTLVATCVAGDLHELGARMVSDFFEMDGWSTYYLGANAPSASVVQTLREYGADVLAISATITYHVGAVEALIAAVRRTPECAGVKILVGGYPFKIATDLWKNVGADGFAPDAEGAVALADRLTGALAA